MRYQSALPVALLLVCLVHVQSLRFSPRTASVKKTRQPAQIGKSSAISKASKLPLMSEIHTTPVGPRLTEDTMNLYSTTVGEDAGTFSLEEQSLKSWGIFTAAVAAILSSLAYVWVYPEGPQGGEVFKSWMEGLAGGDSSLTITYMLTVFAVAHSGLASLRPWGEEIIGARAWRVLFAWVSLPLAFSCIVYFINHRYDGVQLWNLKDYLPATVIHNGVWWTTFFSFLLLYPSTFNLLEVAAVEKPQLHLWETGVIRITRHPQMVGQLMWCGAHTAYIGTSFMCATSAMLCAHHLFACWNGDRRLKDKWGERADVIKDTTSIVPFAAIISGKQQLPADYWKELARLPYAVIVAGTIGAYYAHPFMQAGAALAGY